METENIVLPSLDLDWGNQPGFWNQTLVESPLEMAATGRNPFAPPRMAACTTEVVSPRRLPTLDQPAKTKIAPAVSPAADIESKACDAVSQLWLAKRPRAHQRPASRPDLALIEVCSPLPSPFWMLALDIFVFFGTALTLGGFACLAHLHWG